jgi:branched-chain amino acid transport system ATP-binding protein
LISGFLVPDTGRIRFDGRDITASRRTGSRGPGSTRTFQIVQPFAAQSVRENIAVGAHLHEPRRAAALAQADAVAQRSASARCSTSRPAI